VSPRTLPEVPRLWVYTMVLIVACCLASMVIAIINLT
jgi:hypothetical protein